MYKVIFTQEDAKLEVNWETHLIVWSSDITYPWIPVLPLSY